MIDFTQHPTSNLVALAVGAAARILVRYGFSAAQSAELMSRAWYIVQDRPVETQQTGEPNATS